MVNLYQKCLSCECYGRFKKVYERATTKTESTAKEKRTWKLYGIICEECKTLFLLGKVSDIVIDKE